MDQARKDTVYRGYRVITVTGVVLLITVAGLLTFAVSWVQAQSGWPELPLGTGWTDLIVLVAAAAFPAGARGGAEYLVTRTARSGRGTKFVVALQVVSWATLGIWASFQVPLLLGLVLALLRHRTLFMLPFFTVSGVAAMLVAPRFSVWEHWFALLEHPRKRTRIRTV